MDWFLYDGSLRHWGVMTAERNKQIWTGPEDFDIYSCLIFNCMIEVLFLKRAETRDLALPPVDFKIFLIFLDFLRSLFKPFGANFLY